MLRLSRNSNMARLRRGAGRALVAASLLGLAALPAAVLAEAGAVPHDPGRMARARYLMGTRLSIELADPAGEEVFEAAFAEVARLERVMSNWTETSEVSRLNREAFARPFRCSGDLFAALSAALRFAEETDGAFEPTVEPLVR